MNDNNFVYLRAGLVGDGDSLLYKIGYTDNDIQRETSYKSHACIDTLIHKFYGDEITELAVQLYFKDFRFRDNNGSYLGKELFVHDEFIKDMFIELGSDKSLLYNTIWFNREKLFLPKDFKLNGNKLNKKELVMCRSLCTEIVRTLNNVELKSTSLDRKICKFVNYIKYTDILEKTDKKLLRII